MNYKILLNKLLQKRFKKLLAVDIGSSNIKLAVVDSAKRMPVVAALYQEDLPPELQGVTFGYNASALADFINGIVKCEKINADGVVFTWNFLLLIYPIVCLIFINLGMGLILSALYIFFRDIQYLYGLFTRVIMYGSAIFYSIDILPQYLQTLFYCNPIFVCITYFRSIVLHNAVPDLRLHLLLAGYALLLFGIGCWVYKKYNYKFLYYV